MDISLLLSSFVAPVVVGIGVGWISNLWSSSHGWLRAEVESRSTYYGELLMVSRELREALPHMYQLAARMRGQSSSTDELDAGTSALDEKQIEQLAEKAVARWRAQVAKATLYASGVVVMPIQSSDRALDRALGGFHEVEPLEALDLRCRYLYMWTVALEATIERDMVDLRLRAIRGLPRRQRKAEKEHLKEMANVLESRLAELLQELYALTEEGEKVESAMEGRD